MKTINLDALDRMQHSVELRGRTYTVRAITARIANMIDAATNAEGEEKMNGYLDAVSAIVPDMSRADIEDLTIPQVMAIINLASTEVGIVEEAAADPNANSSASSPATELVPAST